MAVTTWLIITIHVTAQQPGELSTGQSVPSPLQSLIGQTLDQR